MNDDRILQITVTAYNEDADAYSYNGFRCGFFEGLYMFMKLAEKKGISFPRDLFDKAMARRDEIYRKLNQ